jgi:hypothetical protein
VGFSYFPANLLLVRGWCRWLYRLVDLPPVFAKVILCALLRKFWRAVHDPEASVGTFRDPFLLTPGKGKDFVAKKVSFHRLT